MNFISYKQHNIEIQKNLKYWKSKPVLQKIYLRFYKLIAQYLRYDILGRIVEIGSGIGNLKTIVSDCLCTDIFLNPWIDQVENTYKLSFADSSISNLILFDVWHHIEFPGSVLKEFYRVLIPEGRIVIFEPSISLLGFVAYGLFHHEPINFLKPIKWLAPNNFSPRNARYYAAQGNATRIFCSNKYNELLSDWRQITIKRITSISYICSGGYSKPQLYPDVFLPFNISNPPNNFEFFSFKYPPSILFSIKSFIVILF